MERKVSVGPDQPVKQDHIDREIGQFRYLKIHTQTIDLRISLWGIYKPHKRCIYSPEPRTEVYCLRLNFNISK